MSHPRVEVANLRVRYPRRREPALIDVDLRVGEGERILVVGPSAAGKSTLLRAMCGVVPQSVHAEVTGRIRMDGRDPTVEPVADVAHSVGYLGQDPATQVCLPTVESDVAFGLENRAIPREEIGSRVIRALAATGVTHLAKRRVSTLSGGEQQRVALAAVMVGRPGVLLLDEPTSMLDPVAATATSRLLANLPGRPTQVLVEHRLEDVQSLPERMVVLDDGGMVRADGPTGEVLAEHAASILAMGAWIPLATELGLLTGSGKRGPLLSHEEVLGEDGADDLLRRMAAAIPSAKPAVDGEPVLTMRSAGFSYGEREVLRHLDLAARPGEVLAVVGANGSGKSTLLLGAAGLLPPSEGTVTAPSAAMVFQRPDHQFIGRSVADDLTVGVPNLPQETREALVSDTLTATGLEDVAHLDPHRLSGGQKRKLSISSMTILGRPLLLLDEPTYGLDRNDTLATADRVRTAARNGTAVVLATHDLRFAALVADRVAVLGGEGLLAWGTTESIMEDGQLLADAGVPRPALVDWWSHQEDVVLSSLLSAVYCTATPVPT